MNSNHEAGLPHRRAPLHPAKARLTSTSSRQRAAQQPLRVIDLVAAEREAEARATAARPGGDKLATNADHKPDGLHVPGLPSPPTDDEKYWYMGRQHRWLFVLQALSFCLVVYSMAGFAIGDMQLLLFLIPVTLYIISLVVGLMTSMSTKRTDRVDHELRLEGYAPAHYPSVDVYLPTAGDPSEILENTYSHIAGMTWPGVVIPWVLDDGDRVEVRALAERYGFRYRVRPDRGHLKKAGNLRYGFEQSDAEFIVILDADFVPRPDFIANLMPYMDDPKIAIVQSPQFFDTAKSMGWLQRCAGSTQELFYRWIQPSRDRADAAICVGTCALYRRSALAEAGGFAEIDHSEDVYTGVKLMKAGYTSRYVPIIVSKGLCPDTARGFLNQQYRWCTGSMELLRDPEFRDSQHITGWQHLCFWAGFLYYISTAVNAFVAPLSGLAMIWLLPERVRPFNSIYLLGAGLLYFVVLPGVSRSRWRVEVLRIQLLYSFAHVLSIVHVLTGRTQEWVATGAANGTVTPLAVSITRIMKSWVLVTQLAIWGGLAIDIAHYGMSRFWAMLVLALIATYIELPLLFIRVTTKSSPDKTAPSSSTVEPELALVQGVGA